MDNYRIEKIGVVLALCSLLAFGGCSGGAQTSNEAKAPEAKPADSQPSPATPAPPVEAWVPERPSKPQPDATPRPRTVAAKPAPAAPNRLPSAPVRPSAPTPAPAAADNAVSAPPAIVPPAVHAPPPPPEPVEPPIREVSIPSGTLISIRTIEAVDSKTDRVGQTFRASIDEAVVSDGLTVI